MELKEKSIVGWNGGFWVVEKIHNYENVEIWRDGKMAVVDSDSLWVVEEDKPSIQKN